MKENVTMRHAAAMHLRAVRELHQVTPSFFPVLTLYCIFDAMLPYVTVFFSARILTELAVLRRAEILWQWVFAGVVCTGLGAIAKAMLFRRYHSLLNDLYAVIDRAAVVGRHHQVTDRFVSNLLGNITHGEKVSERF